jgi:arylsulfatase A-like enzyme
MSDIMATLAAVAGVDVPKKAAPDSVNQLSVLTDPADAPAVRTELLTMGLVYGGYALRQEEWLYLPNQGSSGLTAPAKPKPSQKGNRDYARLGFVTSDINKKGRIKGDAPPTQLYNLDIDFSQRWNLAVNYPERTEMLEKRLREITRKPEWTVPYKLKP